MIHWPSPVETGATIAHIGVRPLTVPLPVPWGVDVTAVTFIEVTVTDSDGACGVGFSWTPTIGAASVAAMLAGDIRRWATGRSTNPIELWEPLWLHLHEAGGSGITTMAMAGLDLALWDLAALRRDLPVGALVGAAAGGSPAYGSGINLHYDLGELLAQAEAWVADGFDAVKIKVGSPSLARDVERVRAVREVIGDRKLMIDANQRWDLDSAAEAINTLSAFDLTWIEEPLRADDLQGYAALSRRTDVPIACGENLHTRYRFGEFAHSGAVRTLQPNLVRIGGITPLAAVAAACRDSGVDVALHLLPELSGQLAPTLGPHSAVEIVAGSGLDTIGAVDPPTPLVVEASRVWFRPHTGIGIRFRHDPARSETTQEGHRHSEEKL